MHLMSASYGLKEILNNKKTVTLKAFAKTSLVRWRFLQSLNKKRPPCVKGAVEQCETGGLFLYRINPSVTALPCHLPLGKGGFFIINYFANCIRFPIKDSLKLRKPFDR